MKKEIAEQWVAELRSGKWTQEVGHLRTTAGHCCLGVLCEMAKPACADAEARMKFSYGTPPRDVVEWAGMKSGHGTLAKPLLYKGELRDCLAALNDDGMPFSEIADIIEREVENL